MTADEVIDELLQRHMKKSWGRMDPNLIRTYLERVFDDCKWFRDDLGAPYEGGGIKGRGPGLIAFLYDVAKQRGASIMFMTKAIRLLTDSKGRVTGVRARSSSGTVDFEAKAVVLATGSFQGNQEMMLKYVGPEITYGTVLTGSRANTGDGHLMALELGAQLVHLTVCHIRTTDKFFGVGPSRRLANIYPMGVYVNKRCQRFVDEGVSDSDTTANAIAYQPDAKAALIFDDKARAKVGQRHGATQHAPNSQRVLNMPHMPNAFGDVQGYYEAEPADPPPHTQKGNGLRVIFR